jgi:hypothetical protein
MHSERRARHSLISLTKGAPCLKHHFPRWLFGERPGNAIRRTRATRRQRIQAHLFLVWVQAKVAAPKERPLFVLGTSLDRLALQKPPRNTQRTESGAKQHCCGAPVRNLTSWAKEDPPGKAMP